MIFAEEMTDANEIAILAFLEGILMPRTQMGDMYGWHRLQSEFIRHGFSHSKDAFPAADDDKEYLFLENNAHLEVASLVGYMIGAALMGMEKWSVFAKNPVNYKMVEGFHSNILILNQMDKKIFAAYDAPRFKDHNFTPMVSIILDFYENQRKAAEEKEGVDAEKEDASGAEAQAARKDWWTASDLETAFELLGEEKEGDEVRPVGVVHTM